MDRLHSLEHLVRELRGQLEHAQSTAAPSNPGSRLVPSPAPSSTGRGLGDHVSSSSTRQDPSDAPSPPGRLVLQEGETQSHYVGSAFWSRIVDELEGLKVEAAGLAGEEDDSDTSGSETDATEATAASGGLLARGPIDQHAFLFGHNPGLSGPGARQLHPPPLEVPFLLDAFSENVNLITRLVHMPGIGQLTRQLRSTSSTTLSASQEALLFSIYYAAIASMEADEALAHLGSSKDDLMARYRCGLEHALSRANFLVYPDLSLLQAFANFICLARRHDSPRYVYMLTALLVRMAQYLGLHRDGSHLEHLTPFDVQMRRRVWWTVCMLDTRAAEDQGTDLAIPIGSFDTKPPLNINESDLDPHSTSWPSEREGITDMTFARVIAGVMEIHRSLMTRTDKNNVADLEARSRLVNGVFEKFEHEYLRYAVEAGNLLYWLTATVARLVMAKLLLISFLPILFSDPSEHASDDTRHKLLRAAIEVAEYNHALNSETALKQFRWVYQTHTHWYSVVYMMLELARRPWSPISERAWVALQSPWLFPSQSHKDKKLRIWVPLRKLMAQVRRHRASELEKLHADPQTAAQLEAEDSQLDPPSSSGPFPAGQDSVRVFLERWRQLVAKHSTSRHQGPGDVQASRASNAELPAGVYSADHVYPNMSSYNNRAAPTFSEASRPPEPIRLTAQVQSTLPANTAQHPLVAHQRQAFADSGAALLSLPRTGPAAASAQRPAKSAAGPESMHWLWTDSMDVTASEFPNLDEYVDVDLSMDPEAGVNWYSLVESAQGGDGQWPA